MKKFGTDPMFPLMNDGERMVWAATYAVEYNRWTCGDTQLQTSFEVKAARNALAQASMAVLAARAALASGKSLDVASVTFFARQMIRRPERSKRRLEKKIHGRP